MQAVQLVGINDLRLVNVPEPDIQDDEILLKNKAGLICGTDVRMFKNGNTKSPEPRILGHELSGEIAAVGKKVNPRYKVGMRVAVAPNYGCGVCDQCISGNTQLCPDFKAIGIHCDGAFAEYSVIPGPAVRQGNVVELPEILTFAEGAMVEPFACVYNAFERCQVKVGNTVLVIGAGPIGLMHVMLHVLAGASKVFIHDINAERVEMVKKIVPQVIGLTGDNLKEQIQEFTHNKGCDIVITAASVPSIQTLSFDLVALNGRVLFFGGLPKDREMVSLNTNIIHYKQITITGMSGQNLRQYRESLALLANGQIDLKPVLTGRYSLAEYQLAFDDASKGVGLKTGFIL